MYLQSFVNRTVKDSIDNRQTIQNSKLSPYYGTLNYIITVQFINDYA